ncbi:hypothetical protein DFQ30_011442, partial [Apophysomyces sp. BC1015]
TAVLDKASVQAYPQNVLTQQALEELLDQGGYQSGDYILSVSETADTGPLWVSQHSYTTYATADKFYRPVTQQSTKLTGITTYTYDSYSCGLIQTEDALKNQVRAQYDYRFLVPKQIIDINRNTHEAQFDALGRVVGSTFYGTELGEPNGESGGLKPVHVGFKPVSAAPVPAKLTVSQAIDDAVASKPQSLATISPSLRADAADRIWQRLVARRLITPYGAVRSRGRQWAASEPGIEVEGLSDTQATSVRTALRNVTRLPAHSATLTADAYPGAAQPIHIALAYSDGFGRALQAATRVPPGPAWQRTATGELKMQNGSPVSASANPRWTVTGRVEYDNKGQPVRVYQPYFMDDWRYVADRAMRADGYADTHYYDALGREVKVVTAKGYERRNHYLPWFTIAEDENDTGHRRAIPMTETLYTGTPTVTVTDNRGLAVRTLQYNRVKVAAPVDERITATTYSPAGFPLSQTDPRLFASPLADPPGAALANFRHCPDLAGRALCTDSVDAGAHWGVFDIEGRPLWHQDARGTVTCSEYDTLGRLTQVTEQLAGQASVSANLCGVVSTQLDTAGQLTTPGMTLTGQPQAQTRRLPLNPEGTPDWRQDSESQLEKGAYTTHWTYNALGLPLTQTDAMGNVQQTHYDIAGRLASVSLRQAGRPTTQALLKSADYSAHGQIESETAGNGVTTSYTYDPKTLRLTQSLAKDESAQVQQQLVYAYDPVGNILSVEDRAGAPAFFRNQKVKEKSTYAYDALYQLVRATGREQANVQPGRQPPPWITLAPPDKRVKYTRTYTYDRGGNLTGIQGENGASPFTQTMTIERGSNRLKNDVAGWQAGDNVNNFNYDPNGNPGALGAEVLKQLQWDGRNQLQRVVRLERHDGRPDDECYQYDGEGQRIRKLTRTLARRKMSNLHQDEVIYLPGLELRRRYNVRHEVVEELHVMVANQAGRAQVRGLHWARSQPGRRDQFRYSLDNHLGSSVMELDQDGDLLTYEEYYPYGGAVDGPNLYQMVKNSPISHHDDNGLMWKNVIRVVTGLGGIVYEVTKHSQKSYTNQEDETKASGSSKESYGDRRAGETVTGRVEAVGHLAQGKVPGVEALKTGVDTMATVGEFTATGEISQMNKTALEKAAAIDTYNNLGLSVEAIKKTSEGAAVVATMSPEKTEELALAVNQFKEEVKDEVITGVATGMTVGAALDGAAAVVPHPGARIVLKGASTLWRVGGAVNMAEKIGEAAEKHKEAISSEFGHEGGGVNTSTLAYSYRFGWGRPFH